ncbi:CND2 protein, partial [Lanius ludovicianus]|nr:CND2 protein [Lanius ludovicianus]
LGEGDIRTMSQHLSMNPGEYSYFSPRTLSMWAGPEHWRFRHCHKPDAVSEKKSRRRNPRKPFELNFDEDIDFEPYFRQTKEPTTMAKSTLKRQNVRNTTLPEDFHYDPENLRQLFLKPTVKISRNLEPVETLEAEAGVGDYDYNHPNDTCNFCPAPQDPDSDEDPDPVEFQGEAEEFNLTAQAEAAERPGIGKAVSGGDVTTYGELSLIAEPQKINRIAIPYAKTAKKMDMSRLKKEMWELLTEEEGEVRQEPREGKFLRGIPQPFRPDTAAVAGEKLLSDIIKKLLRRLPPLMATNLSVPLAFMCLLHLANEKSLNLESTADLSDVVVKQGD